MIVLGIETSCDETAAAVLRERADGSAELLGATVVSQLEDHEPYGGVVPEIAARAHLELLDRIVSQTLRDAGLRVTDVDAVAATAGPGLIGGLLVGVVEAKAIASVLDVPFLAVNHLEAHALTARFTDALAFPYLVLLVSGGHCQLVLARDVGVYDVLGSTLDDAVGEAFDKVAKMLGLGYPGGPAVEARAAQGDAGRFALPRPLLGRPGCDFSFAGLKTAVRLAIERFDARALDERDVADLCAAFQTAVADVLEDRCRNALRGCAGSPDAPRAAPDDPPATALVVAGGVAANGELRRRLEALAAEFGLRLIAPPAALCTDNAVMVAWVGLERLRRGERTPLDFKARPRWPLSELSAPGARVAA